MVRCRLGERPEQVQVRYVPAVEFDLWRHLMTSKHRRAVTVEHVSVWVPETPEIWDDRIDADRLQPVVRVRFEKPGLQGTVVPVVRYLPTETLREAKAALFAHFDLQYRWSAEVTPGYFISPRRDRPVVSMVGGAASDEEEAELELIS